MCIIIANTSKNDIPKENLKRAAESNPDGLGVAFAEKGNVWICKTINKAEIIPTAEAYAKPGAVLHFRIKTHGSIKHANCHPFPVLLKSSGDSVDLVMFHNGILRFTDEKRGKNDDRTDSEIFAAQYLRPLLRTNPALLDEPHFQDILGQAVSGSKLVFLDSTGKITIINKDAGEEQGGAWYSNKSAFEKPKYTYGGYGVYGSYGSYDLYDSEEESRFWVYENGGWKYAPGAKGALTFSERQEKIAKIKEHFSLSAMQADHADTTKDICVFYLTAERDTSAGADMLGRLPSYCNPRSTWDSGLQAYILTTESGRRYFYDYEYKAWFELPAGDLMEIYAKSTQVEPAWSKKAAKNNKKQTIKA